jgi:hypothetical protein
VVVVEVSWEDWSDLLVLKLEMDLVEVWVCLDPFGVLAVALSLVLAVLPQVC